MLPLVFINLERDVERRRRLEAEFLRLGLESQRLDAVLWNALPEQEQQALYSPDINQRAYHSPLVNGEKGCYASHIKAWKALLASEAEAMVVLEDDVLLDDRFLPVIQAIEGLDVPWDMVKLIGRSQHEKIRARRPLCEGFDLIDYARVPSYTAGYVISRSGARKLLDSRQPFGRPIDVDLRFWWESDLRVFGVSPGVLRLDQTSQVSSIGRKDDAGGIQYRYRKLKMKLQLSFFNWLALRRRGPVF